MYDVLIDFLADFYCADEIQKIKELLLFDYFASDSSDLPPQSLHSVWKSERHYKESATEILTALGKRSDRESTVRFVGNTHYVFDYSKKNPVTDRFDLCK